MRKYHRDYDSAAAIFNKAFLPLYSVEHLTEKSLLTLIDVIKGLSLPRATVIAKPSFLPYRDKRFGLLIKWPEERVEKPLRTFPARALK